MIDIIPQLIPGAWEIRPRIFTDARGKFVKTFHAGLFAARGLHTDFPEEFHTESHRHVIRGLHFQTPPHDHVKVVRCLAGSVLDVAVDLRQGSPTYGRHAALELSDTLANMFYLPPGLAHGFCALTDRAVVAYMVSTTHAPTHDHGIRWNSAGIAWPSRAPLVSERDAGFPTLAEFESPFIFDQRLGGPCPIAC